MHPGKRLITTLLAGLTIAAITTSACGSGAQVTVVNPTAAAPADRVAASATAKPTTAAVAKPTTSAKQAIERPAGWLEASHGDDVEPDYAVVFPQDKVNQITIKITPENWAAMQANMTELLGAAGTGGGGAERPEGGPPEGGPPASAPGGVPPAGAQPPAPPDGARMDRQPPSGAPPGGGRGAPGGNPDMTPVNPMWVSAEVTFNGETWSNVGVRYKGNSTLTGAWRAGSAKLPLKLDFDQFEDEHPGIKNQRFYGFKQLSLANNFRDASYLRDTISYDIMAAAGLVTPETAFYEVMIDYGEGPVSLGLYTMVEVVDDTVIERHFAETDGNIYEAEGLGASLAEGTAGQIATGYQKENNEDAADWSDIQALYDALHSTQRTTDPAAWRASLEAVFDVDAFLEWLAVNSVIQDWDTYGTMSHNYYLYHDPKTDQLVWIAWDHNEALSGGGRGDTSLDKANVGANWPLIRYLLDDPVYGAAYKGYLRSTLTDAFDAHTLAGKVDTFADLIRPYAEKEGRVEVFEAAVTNLKAFVVQRAAAVEAFLAG
jgi:hypothetical protein